MSGPHRPGPTPTDPVDDSGSWRPSLGYLVVALVILVGGLVTLSMSSSAPAPVAEGTASRAPVPVVAPPAGPAPPVPAAVPTSIAAPAATTASAPAPKPQIARTRDPNGDLTPDLSDYVNNGERPTMGEVIDRLHQAGVNSGLGAFSPPGTRPPLVGIAVPEDFPLPEGYVRHYQATDDGQRLEPILMFSPDHRFVDAANQPIAIPSDRVVPPELAPPGLPIRRIVIPAPAQPGR